MKVILDMRLAPFLHVRRDQLDDTMREHIFPLRARPGLDALRSAMHEVLGSFRMCAFGIRHQVVRACGLPLVFDSVENLAAASLS
jgi:hypothetical protein